MQETITYGQWVEKYKPVTNPDGSLKRYAVRGSEFNEIHMISEKTPGRVWTMLDDGIDHIVVVEDDPEPAVGSLAGVGQTSWLGFAIKNVDLTESAYVQALRPNADSLTRAPSRVA